jgi:hypothetical protein
MQQKSLRINGFANDLISIKSIALGVVFFLYANVLKKQIANTGYHMHISFNNWDVTLCFLNDMYLIVYFIIPISLLFSITTILKDFDYHILIRLGSFKKWVITSLVHFWWKISPLMIIWVFISLFMMIGFPISGKWSELSKTSHVINTLSTLTNHFSMPLAAFIAQIVLFFLALSVLHLALSIVYVWTKSKFFMLLVCIIVFLGGSVGFKLLPKELAFLSPTTYFSITKGIDTFNSTVTSYLVCLTLIFVAIFLLQFIDLNKKFLFNSIKPFVPMGIYLLLCVVGISSTAGTLRESPGTTIWDVWTLSFIGVSAKHFSYLSFFFYIIVFFGFIYLIQLFLSQELDQLSYYKIIRFKNLTKWFWSWMKKLFVLVILFLIIIMATSLFIGMCFQLNTNFTITMLPIALNKALYHFFVNGFLQIVFYIMAVFIVSWISKESIHSIILISVFIILMLPGINTIGIIPVGLNSMDYMIDYHPYYQTLILLGMNIISIWIVNYLFRKSLKI